jgi:hypothetical protein
MLQSAFGIASAVVIDSAGHEQVIAGVAWLMDESRRQMTARATRPIALKLDFGEACLGFFGSLGGQRVEFRQSAQDCDGVAVSAELLKMPATGEEMVYHVERHAHGAASVQVMESGTLRSCTS